MSTPFLSVIFSTNLSLTFLFITPLFQVLYSRSINSYIHAAFCSVINKHTSQSHVCGGNLIFNLLPHNFSWAGSRCMEILFQVLSRVSINSYLHGFCPISDTQLSPRSNFCKLSISVGNNWHQNSAAFLTTFSDKKLMFPSFQSINQFADKKLMFPSSQSINQFADKMLMFPSS